jgi:glycosyltransferase involved in cell wall biosynthesis
MKHYKTAICAILKNEHQYLDEWINHHLNVGFDEIYLYEDFGSKSHTIITDKYSNVHLISLSTIFDEIKYLHNYKQTALYIYFYQNYKNVFDYTAFIDIDEFIMFEDGYSLQSLLNEYQNYNGIYLFWKMYNANGIIDNPKSNLVSTYTNIADDYSHDKGWKFKSIVNMNKDSYFKSCHEIYGGITTDGTQSSCDITFGKAWINHYFTKSWEEWCYRFIGKENTGLNRRNLEEFFIYNKDMLSIKNDLYSKYRKYKKDYYSTNEIKKYKNIRNHMISIVTTCYNLEDYIENCLVSLINQSYENLELIVVNDCSTDNSLSIIKKIAHKDSRIKIINNEINLGAGKSRKIGIESAQGDYIMLVDGDDWISENFIKRLYDIALEYDADIVSGAIDYLWKRKNYNELTVFVTEEERIKFLQTSTLDFINNKLIKKSLWEKVPYCERRFIEDTFPYHQLIYYANKIVSNEHDESEYYYYTNRSTSLIHSSSKEKFDLFMNLAMLDMYDFFKDKDTAFKSMCNIYKVRNIVGNFLYPGNVDIEKIKKEYPSEFENLFTRWKKLKLIK